MRNAEADPSAVNGWCLGWCALTTCCGVGWILQMLDREAMAEKHDLKYSACGGCLTAFCCSCCESIQTSKELDYIQLQHRGENGYTPNEKMEAIPQAPLAHQPPQHPQPPQPLKQ
ncbi:uncharacterized protein BP5553_02797 [Venustampulla echinocandica]|uniref:PLAC8 family protein n=1 Tax=Venustampulla echinocandica TaxID=2656787 RepID=A0A370TSE8_9HELO|nr:uncharacterized protein BP5553_02797 [Venustampulla echinocandica]RDL38457.1 hypothetical protein BP5553_02797 [Venustampulla echinocandica]